MNQIAKQQKNQVKTVETLMSKSDVKSKFTDVLGKKAPGFTQTGDEETGEQKTSHLDIGHVP